MKTPALIAAETPLKLKRDQAGFDRDGASRLININEGLSADRINENQQTRGLGFDKDVDIGANNVSNHGPMYNSVTADF